MGCGTSIVCMVVSTRDYFFKDWEYQSGSADLIISPVWSVTCISRALEVLLYHLPPRIDIAKSDSWSAKIEGRFIGLEHEFHDRNVFWALQRNIPKPDQSWSLQIQKRAFGVDYTYFNQGQELKYQTFFLIRISLWHQCDFAWWTLTLILFFPALSFGNKFAIFLKRPAIG